jgi:hypothetical protein
MISDLGSRVKSLIKKSVSVNPQSAIRNPQFKSHEHCPWVSIR